MSDAAFLPSAPDRRLALPLLPQLKQDSPFLRAVLKEPRHICRPRLLRKSFCPGIRFLKGADQLLRFQKICRKAEHRLFSSVVIFRQQPLQKLPLFDLLLTIAVLSSMAQLFQIRLLVLMGDEGIVLVDVFVFFAGVFRTLYTIFRLPMRKAAAGQRTGLAAEAAATA